MPVHCTSSVGSSAEDVAKRFLEHYRSLGYRSIPGSNLLDPAVPMSFVMSAGLAQVESSAALSGGRNGTRYTLVQNCFRYFDLKNIGHSPFHLSFFRMLGAFTFGHCHKYSEARNTIDLLNRVYGLPLERLWVTYFAGDLVAGIRLPADDETADSWSAAGVPDSRIVGLGADQNFWKQNANFVGKRHAAKCGPNTEVFYDRGERLRCGASCRPGCGCGRYVEITNTLFITLSMDEALKTVSPLVEPFTETVIGAERVAMLLHGVHTVFEISCISSIAELVERKLHPDNIPKLKRYERKNNLQVITDHIRAIVYLTGDGAPPPGKGGRRRLMRKLIREMLTSLKLLKISDVEFLPELIEKVIEYSDLTALQRSHARQNAQRYVLEEADAFEETLKRGYHRLGNLLASRPVQVLSGREMLRFEKEHGIPLPLLLKRLEKLKESCNHSGCDKAYRAWEACISSMD